MTPTSPAEVLEKLQEAGVPPPPPTAVPPPGLGSPPPNNGEWTVPFYQNFAAIYNLMSRTFSYTFDDAIKDSLLNAKVMRNDYIIRPAISRRIRPVAQLDWQLEPVDGSNQRLVENAQLLTKIMQRIPRFQQLKRWLLEDRFFGRSGVQLLTGWDVNYQTQRREAIIRDWVPTHPDSIVFRYDGVPGILVNPTEFKGETAITQRGLAHMFTPDELEWFIWSEFEPEAMDFFSADMAGAVHGLGYRGTLYWIWWLREKLTSILMGFAEKVATGITIFYYEQSNAKSQAEVAAAATSQIGNNVYLFPRNRDGATPYSGPGIQRIEVSMAGAEFLTSIWNLCNGFMEQAILGEVATTQSMPGGIGSTAADQHGITADERVKYDANDLEYPIQRLVNALNRWNCPGDPPPMYKHLVDKRNPLEFVQSVQFAYEMGLDISENQIRDELGLPKPQPGEAVLSKIQAMQPAAVGMLPQGMPMSAPAGPAGPTGQPEQANAGQGPGQEADQPLSVQGQQGQPVEQGTPVAMPANSAQQFNRLIGNGKPKIFERK